MRQSQSYPGTASAPPATIEVANANGAEIQAIRVDNPSQKYYFAQFANAYIPPFQIGWVFRYERPVTREVLTVSIPNNYKQPSGPVSGAQLLVVVEVSDNPDEFGYGAPFGSNLGPRSGSAGQAIQEVYIWQTDGPVGIANDLIVRVDGGVVAISGPLGQALMAASIPVVIASDQSAVPVTPPTSATAAETSVAGSASSVSLIAAGTRKGVIIVNESTAGLFVRLGSTAATTSLYTFYMPPGTAANGFAERYIFGFTGAIQGIWASAAGNARITELT